MTPHGPVRIASPSGLAVQINANGSIRRIDCRDVMLNAFLGNELEGGPANLVPAPPRRSASRGRRCSARAAPARSALDETRPRGRAASGQGIRFCVSLALAAAAPAWFWHVAARERRRRAALALDLLHAQDVALADYGTVRLNEYYVSQYVDYTPLAHPSRGVRAGGRGRTSRSAAAIRGR